jgi:hypothetical protein
MSAKPMAPMSTHAMSPATIANAVRHMEPPNDKLTTATLVVLD